MKFKIAFRFEIDSRHFLRDKVVIIFSSKMTIKVLFDYWELFFLIRIWCSNWPIHQLIPASFGLIIGWFSSDCGFCGFNGFGDYNRPSYKWYGCIELYSFYIWWLGNLHLWYIHKYQNDEKYIGEWMWSRLKQMEINKTDEK